MDTNRSTLANLLSRYTDLNVDMSNHLRNLVAQWQLLSDLSFSDLTLWVINEEISQKSGFICAAQCRPNTFATVYTQDRVGENAEQFEQELIKKVFIEGRILSINTVWINGFAIKIQGIPIRLSGQIIGVLMKSTNASTMKMSSTLEVAYLESSSNLTQMISEGNFPQKDDNPLGYSTPRAGDGFIRLDSMGDVVFVSPNGLSAYRRLGYRGDLTNENFKIVTSNLIVDSFEASDLEKMLDSMINNSSNIRYEIESDGVNIMLRGISLSQFGQKIGAIILLRDLTEIKIRERANLSKDATVREINHRVKNNLQSVSALLRLQSRRSSNEEVKEALNEAIRRINSIAIVHQTLAISVDEQLDVDDVVEKILPSMSDLVAEKNEIKILKSGLIGVVQANIGMPLVMVITELIQNSLEHAFDSNKPGIIEISCMRTNNELLINVSDNGKGLPDGFSIINSERLGLNIVKALVQSDLKGSFSLLNSKTKGANATVSVPLNVL